MDRNEIRILCIEEAETDFCLMQRQIKQDGLNAFLRRVDTPESLYSSLRQEQWDLILADYGIATMQIENLAMDIARFYRHIPIILVSDRIGEEKIVDCMRSGVRDFVLKDRLTRLSPAIIRALKERRETSCDIATDQELRIAAIAFESQEAMIITDSRARIYRVNPAFLKLTGYSAEEIVGRTPKLQQSGRHPPDFYRSMREELVKTHYWFGEVWNRRKNGEIYPVWLTVTAVPGSDGLVSHYVGILRDLTEEKRSADRIHQLAYFDVLTGLPNRRTLRDRMKVAVGMNRTSGRFGSLALIDLDNFKMINDAMGHDRGDRLLEETANRLRFASPESDTVARLGGDEFAILFNALAETGEEACARSEGIIKKIHSLLQKEYSFGEIRLPVTSSIGVTVFDGAPSGVDGILKQADLAMYQAKSRGRNSVCFFDPGMQASIDTRLNLEADLRLSVEKGDFILHYQPKVDRNGNTIGVEALVRWPHATRGLVPPSLFIPLAEETGLIVAIGRLVTDAACTQLALWNSQAARANLRVAVNLSARQFRSPTLVDEIQVFLRRRGVLPQHLTLELTESLLVEDLEATLEKLNTLRGQGIRFALDDFGTGYSSLSYLRRLPFDEVKIDSAFVKDVLVDEAAASLVRTIIAMGHSLDLTVVAEGVETEAQWDLLRSAGCDQAQGFLFGKPVPAEMLVA